MNPPKSLAHTLAHLLTSYPRSAMLLALLLAALAVPGMARLSSDFSYRIWFPPDDPLLQEFDAFERRFGNDESIALVVHSPDGIFDRASLTLLQQLTREMWQVPEIIRVESLTNFNWTHGVVHENGEEEMRVAPLIPEPYEQELTPELIAERRRIALGHELLPGYLVSQSGQTAVIFGVLKPAIGGSPDFEKVINATRDLLRPHLLQEGDLQHGVDNHLFHITGGVAVTDAFREVTFQDMEVMLPMLLGAIILFLLLTFKNFWGLLIPFTIIFSTIALTLGLSGWLGIKINNTTATVPHILVAISIADAVHLLVTYFQYRRKGFSPREATYHNLVKNLLPVFLTSLTTSIGLFSFATADVVPVATMGLLAGIGTLIAFLLTILLVGPLLVLLPIRVSRRSEPETSFQPAPWALVYANWLHAKRHGIIIAFLVLTAAAMFFALRNEINSDPFRYFAKDVPVRQANEFLEGEIGGSMAMEITVNAGEAEGIYDPAFLGKVEQFQQWLGSFPHVTKTVSILDVLKQINRTLHNEDPAYYRLPATRQEAAEYLFLYTMSLPQGMDLNDRMTLDNDMIRLSAMWTLHSSKESLEQIALIEQEAARIGLDANISGKMPIWHGLNPKVVNTFLVSIALAVLLVSLIMVLVFKSIKIGLLSMIPNLVPIAYGLGLMTLLGTTLDMGTVIVASVCLGISVDDTIHFITNYSRMQNQGASPREAIAQVFTHTGPALVITTLVLVTGFGTFAFASFVPNINFGILCAVILSSALVADLVLLPALLLSNKTKVRVAEKQEPGGSAEAMPA